MILHASLQQKANGLEGESGQEMKLIYNMYHVKVYAENVEHFEHTRIFTSLEVVLKVTWVGTHLFHSEGFLVKPKLFVQLADDNEFHKKEVDFSLSCTLLLCKKINS